MVLAFYIPQCSAYQELHDLVVRNGGRVIDQHECFSYQIKPEQGKTSFQNYYKGDIYSSRWIVQSIKEKKCLKKDEFFVCINVDEKSLRLNIGKKKKYTIIEGMKLYETMTNHKNLNINQKQFWLKVQSQDILPERSADWLKNFWTKNQYKTLEEFLIECVHEKIDFCLSFKEIPNPDFEPRFRTQFANEFLKLESLQNMSDNDDNNNEEKNINLYGSIINLGRKNSGFQTPKTSSLNEILQDKLGSEQIESKPQAYKFKELKKLNPEVNSYDPINEQAIYLSLDKRSSAAPSLEQELENLLSQRMRKFVPTNFDLVDYDKELFKKQIDLEIVEITLNRDAEKEKEYEQVPFYTRTVNRCANEEGMFKRLQQELLVIGKQYGVQDEEINRMFI